MGHGLLAYVSSKKLFAGKNIILEYFASSGKNFRKFGQTSLTDGRAPSELERALPHFGFDVHKQHMQNFWNTRITVCKANNST